MLGKWYLVIDRYYYRENRFRGQRISECSEDKRSRTKCSREAEEAGRKGLFVYKVTNYGIVLVSEIWDTIVIQYNAGEDNYQY